jgi:hypothetical protein
LSESFSKFTYLIHKPDFFIRNGAEILMDMSRKIRIGVGAAIMIAGLVSNAGWWLVGLFPLITGVLNMCPGGTCAVPEPKSKSQELSDGDEK